MSVPLGMFGIGSYELLVFAVIALLLFGNRLPSVMRSMGRGIVEFKKGVQGIEDDVNDAVSSSDKTPAAPKDSETNAR